MLLHRRTLLAAAPVLLAAPALAKTRPGAPPLFGAYEQQTGGRIGVFIQNLASGEGVGWRADERFVMCSTFKASLVGMVLGRVEHGHERLERAVRFGPAELEDYAPIAKANLARRGGELGELTVAELCAGAASWSDNTCANLLLASVGGPSALTGFWRRIGDPVTRLDHNEPELNRSPPGDPHDTTTPRAMAGNLQKLLLAGPLSQAGRDRLGGWLVDCKTGDNRLRGGLPKTWKIANKTGNNGKDASGDIALVWPAPDRPVAICVYTQGGSPSPEQVQATFAAIGRMVGEHFA